MKTARWLGFGAPLGLSIAALVAASSGGCTITNDPLDGGNFNGTVNTDAGNTDAGNTNTDASPVSCSSCLFQQCSGSWAVCQNDPECRDTYSCTIACTSQECVNACFCNHPLGQAKYVTLAACDSYYACGTCKNECPTLSTAEACVAPGVVDRDICGTAPVDAGADDAAPLQDASLPPTDAAAVVDCTGCTTNSCSAEKSACVSGSECETYTLCLAACTAPACFDDCGTKYAAGKTASQALETCTISYCKDACGL